MIEEWNSPSAEYALRGALCASSPMAAKLRRATVDVTAAVLRSRRVESSSYDTRRNEGF